MDPQKKGELARSLFLEGYNCSQSVFAAFAEEMGMEQKEALRLSCGLGGGVGGLRQICGAVSASALALGRLTGYDDPQDLEGKKRLYARVQALRGAFVEEFGDSCCSALLQKNGVSLSSVPAERTPEYYRRRPCARFIETAARLLAEELASSPAAPKED